MMAHGKRLMVALVLLFGMNIATANEDVVTAEICEYADIVYTAAAGAYILNEQDILTYDEWKTEFEVSGELEQHLNYAFLHISVEGAGWQSLQDAQDWVEYQDVICRGMIGKVPPQMHE